MPATDFLKKEFLKGIDKSNNPCYNKEKNKRRFQI
jgi:hypothetical protein